jgi:hypothetical protein
MLTLTLQHNMGYSSSEATERDAHAKQRKKLRRVRGFSRIDQLVLRVKSDRTK